MPQPDAEQLVRKLRGRGGGGAALAIGGMVLLAGIALIAFGAWGMTATADGESTAGGRGGGKILAFGVMVAIGGGGTMVRALT